MSDTIDQQGCFRHRANARYFTIYEDFQDIAKGKHADKTAALLRILEVKTNKRIIAYQVQSKEAKQNDQPSPKLNLWLEVSYNDFVSWSLHTFGKSSFQIADKEAEKLLFCKSRLRKRRSRPEDPQSPFVEYKEYLLVLENVQAALDGQELPIVGENFEAYDTPTSLNITRIEKNTGLPAKNTGYNANNRYKSNGKESNGKEKIGSSTTHNYNASPLSKNNEENTQAAAHFKDEEQQAIWSVVCQAREELISKRAKEYGMENLEEWKAPTRTQRQQVARIIAILKGHQLQISDFTPSLIRQAWQYAVDVKKFTDTVWKLGNLENELPVYLTLFKPEIPQQQQEAPKNNEDLEAVVLWTRTPHLMLGTLEQYWHILEWMSEREARKHKYGEYEPFTAKEIERYRQLTSQQSAYIAQKATSYEPMHHSHPTNAVESTR